MKEPAKTFEDLIVWQKSHKFVLDIYKLSNRFPKTEAFGITSQLRRAAISISANIAEGFKRQGKQDKARFMNIAQGSIEECRYYLRLVHDLGYADTYLIKKDLSETSRILYAYHKSILAKD